MKHTPVALLILDGWGIAPAGPGNAVTLARTPNLHRLADTCPHTRLACSGLAVGLPAGFMGNSEVGHMNIGAGRVVYQDMTRIDLAVEDKSLSQNAVLVDLAAKAKASGGKVHLMGLVSDGGVHSHLKHLEALLAVFGRPWAAGASSCTPFLTARDTPPESGGRLCRGSGRLYQASGVRAGGLPHRTFLRHGPRQPVGPGAEGLRRPHLGSGPSGGRPCAGRVRGLRCRADR